MDIITLALCKRMGKSKADIDGVYPNLIAGGVVESEVRDEDFSNKVTEHTGTAFINSIKGNTIVWNQLVRNGNFESISGWEVVRGTPTTSNNVLSYKVDVLGGGGLQNRIVQNISIPTNHKVFYNLNINPPKAFSVIMNIGIEFVDKATTVPNTWNLCRGIRTLSSAMTDFRFGCPSDVGDMAIGDVIQFKDVMLIDLTQMFGSGNEPTTVEEFTSLFSLPYYSYNQGSLLSFNGNGIKTVGKNILVDSGYVQGVLGWNNSPSDSNIIANNAYISSPFIPIPNGVTQITITSSKGNIVRYWEADSGYNGLYFSGNHPMQGETITRTLSQGCRYIRISIGQDGSAVLPSDYGTVVYGQIEFGNQATSYEPYTSHTTNLPISTYFPTGMKSAGNVYDELTESKAITRIGAVDLGTLSWNWQSTWQAWYTYQISTSLKGASDNDTKPNIVSANYPTLALNFILGTSTFGISISNVSTGSKLIAVENGSDTVTPTGYLYYELATPTETNVNLDLSYKTYEGGTEQLLPENGSVPVTSPMKTNVEFDFDENINALLDKMLNMIAPVETSPTSNAYSVGQYLIYDYVLYKVTSAIASGGTITVGTNVEATTIASVLESL